MGVSMPSIRKIAKEFQEISLSELQKSLENQVHEVRLCSLIILVYRYQEKQTSIEEKKNIVEFYLNNTKYINNWDLVDCSAHYVIGQAVLDEIVDRDLLFQLIQSTVLWERRIGIVATWILIRNQDIDTTLALSQKLLQDTEDLMHKAVGWMLREAWKVDADTVESFLIKNYKNLPRTTLRYAIERIEEQKRKKFLQGEFG